MKIDQKTYSAVEKIVANVSIASVRSWMKGTGRKFSAGKREQMVARLASKIQKEELTFGELEDAVIGIEEAGGKLIYLFELDHGVKVDDVKKRLEALDISLLPRRSVARSQPVRPSLAYSKIDGSILRIKWSETHRDPKLNIQKDKIDYNYLTKIVVLVADLSSGTAEIRYDQPEQLHPHAKPEQSNPKEAYFQYYVAKVSDILGVTLTKSEIREGLKQLVESTPRLIRLHVGGHTNQRNNRYRVASDKADIRDDEDWQVMHARSGSTWTHDRHSFYWRKDQSQGKLTREVYSLIDAVSSTMRVEADCWDAEVEYAVNKIRELSKKEPLSLPTDQTVGGVSGLAAGEVRPGNHP